MIYFRVRMQQAIHIRGSLKHASSALRNLGWQKKPATNGIGQLQSQFWMLLWYFHVIAPVYNPANYDVFLGVCRVDIAHFDKLCSCPPTVPRGNNFAGLSGIAVLSLLHHKCRVAFYTKTQNSPGNTFWESNSFLSNFQAYIIFVHSAILYN